MHQNVDLSPKAIINAFRTCEYYALIFWIPLRNLDIGR